MRSCWLTWCLAVAGVLAAGGVLSPAQVLADVRLPAVFGNEMVLQRGIPLAFWGWAEPGEEVSVTVGAGAAKVAADANGAWKLSVPAVDQYGPVSVKVQGKNAIELTGVLVGEVWVCSGQSNMEWSIRDSGNPDEEIAAANYPDIRFIRIPKLPKTEPLADTQGQWLPVTSKNVDGGTGAGLTAVGYYFGRALHKELKCPIGLIHCAWGGTIAEAWMSDAAVRAKPQYAAILERAAQANADAGRAGDPNRASVLYNGMLHPIIPFGIRGAIWYQGESNAGRAMQYRTLFPDLIADWRQQWGQGDFPFYFVQLSSWQADGDVRSGKKPAPTEPTGSSWAELREAQTMTLGMKNTGMAVTIDIGHPTDIHPKNKQAVGLRLALNALHQTYGQEVVYSGPLYQSQSVEGDKIRLHFEHGAGLKSSAGDLTGFAIAGEDQQFVWAKATIDGETIVVHAEGVAHPVAVRYGWADYPACNLFNGAGLPASPFRTDTFPGWTDAQQ